MAEADYEGSCHCGAVRFSARLDLTQVITCNCSRCQRLGAVLAFAPAEAVTVASGEDRLTEYRFNKMVIAHRFCSICGIETFGAATMPDGAAMMAVNVNCLHGIDPRALPATHVDGASR